MRVFINGISSWIGYYLGQYIGEAYPEWELIGTYRYTLPENPNNIKIEEVKIGSNLDSVELMWHYKPKVFINLTRGEQDADMMFHEQMIKTLNKINCHYAYASTFNVCDGDPNHDHSEDAPVNARSEYGIFKGQCEEMLRNHSENYSIFRFGAIHGWIPYRASRTELFLRSLQAGKTSKINDLLIQNRPFTMNVAGMIADIIANGGKGMFNLGTTDANSEVDFHRNLAKAFGYPENLIEVESSSACNAFMVPKKVFELTGDKWKKTQKELIDEIRGIPEFQKYVHSK